MKECELGEIVVSNIKHLRQQKGYTQLQLSIKSGMGDTYIHCMENGFFYPKLDAIEKISKALNVKPCDLLERDFINLSDWNYELEKIKRMTEGLAERIRLATRG